MISDYSKLLRVSHWIKNIFVFVPILFSKHLFNWFYFSDVLFAFITFSLAASLIYIFNDLIDVEYDRKHPVKKYRPIASGKVSVQQAKYSLVILLILIIILTSQLNWAFTFTLMAYVVINVFYTLLLKNIIIMDVLSIASGFMLRVLAGAFVIDIYISNWLILTTIFLALYLAAMKRRSELHAQVGGNSTRAVLKDYSKKFIDIITLISGIGLIACYILYSVSERTLNQFGSKYFIFTSIFVAFGVLRYMFLVLKRSKGENPTEIMLTDIPMIVNTLLYIFVIITIIYIK